MNEQGEVILRLKEELRTARAHAIDIEAELQECRRDNSEAGEAAHEALLDELADWIEQQRGA
jgi:hypothetical protein